MSSNFIAVLVAASLGQFPIPLPFGGGGAGAGPGPGSSPYGGGAVYSAPDSTQAFGTGDPTNPYDFEPNWAHGYYQDIPAYHGSHFFRPYNYKHVMPQSQVSAAWGNSPNMPYSHQYFDKVSGHPTVWNNSLRSNVAHQATDLNAQLSAVDRPRIGKTTRRQVVPNMVYAPAGKNVTTGYREHP